MCIYFVCCKLKRWWFYLYYYRVGSVSHICGVWLRFFYPGSISFYSK